MQENNRKTRLQKLANGMGLELPSTRGTLIGRLIDEARRGTDPAQIREGKNEQISEIIAHQLFVSDRTSAQDVGRLLELGIYTVISLSEKNHPEEVVKAYEGKDIHYTWIPDFADSQESNLKVLVERIGVDFLQSRIAKGGILLHCSAGVSRSPSLAMWMMAKFWNMDLFDALELLQKSRRCCYPQACFLEQLVETCCRKES